MSDGFPVAASAAAATLYISFDLETLGGNPADLPVINWGFVAYLAPAPAGAGAVKKIGQLSVNMKPLHPDPSTVAWFNSTPDLKRAYEECTKEPVVSPTEGMEQIRYWINEMTLLATTSAGAPPRILFVAYPTIFDGSLLYYYWFRYLGHPTNGRGPGFTMLDIRSYAAGRLGIPYHEASKEKALRPYCPDKLPHTHTGIDDAEEQMWLLFNIMKK